MVLLAACFFAFGCGSGDADRPAGETVATSTWSSGDVVSPETVVEAWTPAKLIFVTTMLVAERGVVVRHEILSDADSGKSLQITRDSAGNATRAMIVDRRLRMTTVDADGSRNVRETALSGAPLQRSLPLLPLLAPVGGLTDPRVAWGPATVHPRGLTLATSPGGPFEAVLILEAGTLFPLEYSVRQGDVTLTMTFVDTRLIAATPQTRSLFDETRIEDRLK